MNIGDNTPFNEIFSLPSDSTAGDSSLIDENLTATLPLPQNIEPSTTSAAQINDLEQRASVGSVLGKFLKSCGHALKVAGKVLAGIPLALLAIVGIIAIAAISVPINLLDRFVGRIPILGHISSGLAVVGGLISAATYCLTVAPFELLIHGKIRGATSAPFLLMCCPRKLTTWALDKQNAVGDPKKTITVLQKKAPMMFAGAVYELFHPKNIYAGNRIQHSVANVPLQIPSDSRGPLWDVERALVNNSVYLRSDDAKNKPAQVLEQIDPLIQQFRGNKKDPLFPMVIYLDQNNKRSEGIDAGGLARDAIATLGSNLSKIPETFSPNENGALIPTATNEAAVRSLTTVGKLFAVSLANGHVIGNSFDETVFRGLAELSKDDLAPENEWKAFAKVLSGREGFGFVKKIMNNQPLDETEAAYAQYFFAQAKLPDDAVFNEDNLRVAVLALADNKVDPVTVQVNGVLAIARGMHSVIGDYHWQGLIAPNSPEKQVENLINTNILDPYWYRKLEELKKKEINNKFNEIKAKVLTKPFDETGFNELYEALGNIQIPNDTWTRPGSKMSLNDIWDIPQTKTDLLKIANKPDSRSTDLMNAIQGQLSSDIVIQKLHFDGISSPELEGSLKEWIRDCDREKLEKFVKAVTGSAALGPSAMIEITIENRSEKLPDAHTCFFQLKLPDYPDKATLTKKLNQFLEHAEGFGIE